MAGEAAGVVEPPFGVVCTDVIAVPLPKLLNGIFNGSEGRNHTGQTSVMGGNRIPLDQESSTRPLTLTRRPPASL